MRARTPLLDAANAPAAILAASIAVLGTALAAQYWGGLAPCELCLYQRWPYAVAIALSLAGLVALRGRSARRRLTGLCAAAFAVGAGIAFYHAGVEQGWFAGPATCSGVGIDARSIEELKRLLEAAPVVRCDEIPWSMFGISLAGYNFIVSAALAVASAIAASRRGRTA